MAGCWVVADTFVTSFVHEGAASEVWNIFSIQLVISSSQLTKSYFSEGQVYHQPDIYIYIPMYNLMIDLNMCVFQCMSGWPCASCTRKLSHEASTFVGSDSSAFLCFWKARRICGLQLWPKIQVIIYKML